jgi:hypothetical protein
MPPLTVSSVSVSPSPASFDAACQLNTTVTFTATIHAPAGTRGGTITYHWLRSDGTATANQSTTFAAGQTAKTVTTTWALPDSLGNGSTRWAALQTTAPNGVTSPHANFTFHCQFTVTSIHVSVGPATYPCGDASQTFTFTATIHVGATGSGGSIKYSWARSDHASSPAVYIFVPPNTTTVTVMDTWTLFTGVPNGSYWEQVSTTMPNGATSNQATFTVSC